MVKMSSKGGVIYKQERIGLFGRPFHIYKFRSMYLEAENSGPALSSKLDPRITPWGRFMRKWRIDELPQFLNILKGDMSLVGPRPERKHYINIISESHPHYKYLHKVKPGLTSWGMVQFGYAENVGEMIERMKYDLLYIENCSLALDLKIIMYTFIVIFQGRGK
jgi:lipopolysaccharide/colanic/teichoic acid biosynthesis glycosyltransferase